MILRIFRSRLDRRKYKIIAAVQFFFRLKATPENLNATELLLVPGVLADIFESVAGAIYKNLGFFKKAVYKFNTPFLTRAYGNEIKLYFPATLWHSSARLREMGAGDNTGKEEA